MQLTNAARRTLAALAALALLLGCLPALAEMKPLSLEEVAQAPAEQYYTSDTHYEDPSLTVDIGEGRIHETNYVYAVIKIADPSQIRSAMAYKYNSGRVVSGIKMAKANNAVLAVDADYHNHYEHGYTVRQGVEYRVRPDPDWDILMIDQYGDMNILISPTDETLEVWRAEHSDLTIINSFNFGPVYTANGEWRQIDSQNIRNYYHIAGSTKAARTAICQLDPLTYLVVSCESAMDKGSAGMTMEEFSECLQEVENNLADYEIQIAYNLDGGRSSTVVFHDQRINSPNSNKTRDISDIIYFATAWEE